MTDLNILYKPTPPAYKIARDLLRLIGHLVPEDWSHKNNEHSTIVCGHCHIVYLLEGSYGSPVYYLRKSIGDLGTFAQNFEASVVTSFYEDNIRKYTVKQFVRWVPQHFYCYKISSFVG